jgi:hypothetical protein
MSESQIPVYGDVSVKRTLQSNNIDIIGQSAIIKAPQTQIQNLQIEADDKIQQCTIGDLIIKCGSDKVDESRFIDQAGDISGTEAVLVSRGSWSICYIYQAISGLLGGIHVYFRGTGLVKGSITLQNATSTEVFPFDAPEDGTHIGGIPASKNDSVIVSVLATVDAEVNIGGSLSVNNKISAKHGDYMDIFAYDAIIDTIVSRVSIESSTITANTFIANSDRKLKTNIQSYVPSHSILQLPIYEYDYIHDGQHTIGCMAQDLQTICPELVEEKNGILSIQENKLIYLLLHEIKLLKKEVEALRK